MINNSVVMGDGGGKTATVTIYGPSSMSPTQSLVYLHGGGADYVDIKRNSISTIQVDVNTFITGATRSVQVTGDGSEENFGEAGTDVIIVNGDCEIRF